MDRHERERSCSAGFAATQALLADTSLGHFLHHLGSLVQQPPDRPPKPPSLVKLSTGTPLAEALKELASYNILSAPVVDPSTASYVGILDVGDVLRALCERAYPELMRPGFIEAHRRLSMAELQAIGVDLAAQPVEGMLHGGELWYKGDAQASVLDVVRCGFRVGQEHTPSPSAQHAQRVNHRVAVFDILPGEQTPDGPIPEWRITQVVSQTDVLRLLASRVGTLAAADPGWGASLADLGLVQGAGAMVTVDPDTPALRALALMQRHRVSGAAVVAHGAGGGGLLGNLSVSDLRGLTPDRFGALALPVGAFLLLTHPGNGGREDFSFEDALLGRLPVAAREGRWGEALGQVRSHLVSCSPDTTLREALELLVREGKHRVHVCDGQGRPVGLVTPTDVLRVVAQ